VIIREKTPEQIAELAGQSEDFRAALEALVRADDALVTCAVNEIHDCSVTFKRAIESARALLAKSRGERAVVGS
jgi:hypothetical protein